MEESSRTIRPATVDTNRTRQATGAREYLAAIIVGRRIYRGGKVMEGGEGMNEEEEEVVVTARDKADGLGCGR